MSELVDDVFYSSLINKNVPYRALIPGGLSRRDRPVPVLYLLHGLFGSAENWTELTNLQQYAEDADILIVMPDGGDNWYTDSQEKFESYLIHDLMPEMELRFRASTERGQRAIAGNSMGGYGAIKLALRYPDRFSVAASFSGAFHVTRFLPGMEGGELAPSIVRVFGDKGSPVRDDNDLFEIAVRSGKFAVDLPSICFDCGIRDEFLFANREFSATLHSAGIKHQFLEIDGGHDWLYWDKRIKYLIPFISKEFSDIAE